MKAVIVKAPGIVAVEVIPEPVVEDYDALCSVLASGICNGTDNNIVMNDPYHKVKFPAVLGHEGIGKVIALGKKVRFLKIGDMITRIFQKLPEGSGYQILYGAFAERAVATDWQAMKEDGLLESEYNKYRVHRVLPRGFDPIESTLIITWRETFAYLSKLKPEAGQNVLIIGSGGNAMAFLDHVKNLNMSSGIIGNPLLKEKFLRKGADFFISYKEGKLSDILLQTKKTFDIILDTIGEPETLQKALPTLKPRGKIGVYGLDNFLEYKVVPRDLSFLNGEKYDEASAHDSIIDFIQKNKLNAWDYISKDYICPLAKIIDALRAGEEKKVLKSVIDMSRLI